MYSCKYRDKCPLASSIPLMPCPKQSYENCVKALLEYIKYGKNQSLDMLNNTNRNR